ncbi:MAG: hypothetical protein EOO03_13725 [Chitinophagaceae bacterium]|nr:MAG: hypothetical protein EOO03_13725 [Chitinophagaceae bacterium]
MLLLLSCNSQKEKTGSTTVATDTLKAIEPAQPVNAPDSLTINVSPNQLIVAGKSIGLTAIGQTGADLSKNLGQPDDGDAAMGKSISTWYSKTNPAYKTQVFSSMQNGTAEDRPKVKSIRINNPFFQSYEGLKPGSHLKEILTAYPALLLSGSYKTANNKTVKVYDDFEKGIAFEINENDSCIGICVHTVNEKAFMQYLPFENSFQPVEN